MHIINKAREEEDSGGDVNYAAVDGTEKDHGQGFAGNLPCRNCKYVPTIVFASLPQLEQKSRHLELCMDGQKVPNAH